MTIDERLEAISRKFETAATLHVELEQQMADGFAEIRARFAETDKRFAEVAARFSETLVFINRLAHVAEAHEQRLDDIEGH
jgi:hypothetical protein